MQRPTLVVVVAGLFAAIASPALAQDEAGGGEARTLFKQGQTAYDQGDYETAIDKWNRAYELDPKPLIQFNLSQAYERLGELPKAVAALERYLDTAEADDPNQANARARLSSLRDRLESTGIKIVGAPEGAEIVVDGEAWGRTPRPDPIPVEPGSHEVVLTNESQETFRSTVAAPAGQVVELEASMQASGAEGETTAEGDGGAGTRDASEDGSVVPWVLVGVGGGITLGGVVTGALALAASGGTGDAKEGTTARSLAKWTDGLLWPGLAITTAGIIWAVVGGGDEQNDAAAAVQLAPYAGRDGAGVGAWGRF